MASAVPPGTTIGNNPNPGTWFSEVDLANDTSFTLALPRGIYVGGDGTVKVADADGNTTTFTGVRGGSILPIRPYQVLSTANGTTATGLVAIF